MQRVRVWLDVIKGWMIIRNEERDKYRELVLELVPGHKRRQIVVCQKRGRKKISISLGKLAHNGTRRWYTSLTFFSLSLSYSYLHRTRGSDLDSKRWGIDFARCFIWLVLKLKVRVTVSTILVRYTAVKSNFDSGWRSRCNCLWNEKEHFFMLFGGHSTAITVIILRSGAVYGGEGGG